MNRTEYGKLESYIKPNGPIVSKKDVSYKEGNVCMNFRWTKMEKITGCPHSVCTALTVFIQNFVSLSHIWWFYFWSTLHMKYQVEWYYRAINNDNDEIRILSHLIEFDICNIFMLWKCSSVCSASYHIWNRP